MLTLDRTSTNRLIHGSITLVAVLWTTVAAFGQGPSSRSTIGPSRPVSPTMRTYGAPPSISAPEAEIPDLFRMEAPFVERNFRLDYAFTDELQEPEADESQFFGEMYHEKRFVEEENDYVGEELLLPTVVACKVFPMANIPKKGYPGISDGFNHLYTSAVMHMQRAWELQNDEAAQDELLEAVVLMMDEMPTAARKLMERPILPDAAETYGPSFRYCFNKPKS